MRNVPAGSEVLRFADALELASTPTGSAPRCFSAWTRPQLSEVALDAVIQMPAGVRLEFTSPTTSVRASARVLARRAAP
jgi:hypothetical protein